MNLYLPFTAAEELHIREVTKEIRKITKRLKKELEIA